MLTFVYHRIDDQPMPVSRPEDLQVRNLLDDPALRRAMGLGPVAAPKLASVRPLPTPRFDVRRLLHRAAA